MKYNELLLNHNYVSIKSDDTTIKNTAEAVATIAVNIANYGRGLSQEAYSKLKTLDSSALVSWWEELEAGLKKITGADKKMGKHMVYKNFPKEVLDKSEMEYWIPQVLMYWGFPKEFFTEEEAARPKLKEKKSAVILHLADDSDFKTAKEIIQSIAKTPAAWKPLEVQAMHSFGHFINVPDIPFKENLVNYAKYLMSKNIEVHMNSATDVLRIAAAFSGADPSLKDNFKFKSFSNKMRRMFLNALNGFPNLNEDVAARKELWKRFLFGLHAKSLNGKYNNVVQIVDDLYKDSLHSFNSKVEVMLKNKDIKVLDLLSQRPGVFKRRFVHAMNLFGDKAVYRFLKDDVISKLTVFQLTSLQAFLSQKNENFYRAFPPKGNWSKMQIVENKFSDQKVLDFAIDGLKKAIAKKVPKVKMLDEKLKNVKLPSAGDTVKYTRGTEVIIPDNMKFLRIASYWQAKQGTVWFDNGVNFFDSDWKSVGDIAWNYPKLVMNKEVVAAFSGDPVNSFTAEKKACQVIDIYMNKLPSNVRYGVWNILCFSRVKFSEVEEVMGCLQWGEDPFACKVFEPSRAQLTFPVTGNYYTKYVCVFDFLEKKMILLDADFKASVTSAHYNASKLEQVMPAFMEYIKGLPSVYDVFEGAVDKTGESYMLYSDKNVSLSGENAYVFKPENENNKFNQIDINSIIS